jgi:hypothetical protein
VLFLQILATTLTTTIYIYTNRQKIDVLRVIVVVAKDIVMSKSNKKSRKTHSDKFPLTLHPTGQFCKKIKGKIYYFGKNKQKALQTYLEQASYLHAEQFTDT